MIAVATDTNAHYATTDAEGNVTGVVCGKMPKRHWIIDTNNEYKWVKGQGWVQAAEGEQSFSIKVGCNRCTGAHRLGNRVSR